MWFLMVFLLQTKHIYNIMANSFNNDKDSFNRALQHTHILKGSFFSANFSTPDLIQLDVQNEKIGIQLSGQETVNRLKLLFDEKVKLGKDVHLLVVGGSSSLGADLGCQSEVQTFHAAFTSWWNEIVYPHTNSRLHKHVVAIGGVGTSYMSHCWKNYLQDVVEIDLLFWEFFINDFFYDGYDESVKRFLSGVLGYQSSKPAPIFIKFSQANIFPGDQLTCVVTNLKFQQKAQVIKENVERFRVSTIDMQRIICDNLKNKMFSLSKEKYFINHHPSHLAHAQIGYSLINYIRNILITFLNSPSSTTENELTVTRDVMVKQEAGSFGMDQCFTALLPYPNFPIMSIFNLTRLWHYGYRARTKSKWHHSNSVRNDVRGGLLAVMPLSSIAFALDQNILYKQSNIYLVISHQEYPTSFYIIATVKKDDGTVIRSSSIDCSKSIHPALSVDQLASNVYGNVQVEISDPLGRCLLNAIIVG